MQVGLVKVEDRGWTEEKFPYRKFQLPAGVKGVGTCKWVSLTCPYMGQGEEVSSQQQKQR